MADYNVHIVAWGDRDECERAIRSVPTGVTVRVFDGRYRDFPGQHDVTPGLEAVCEDHGAVYHAPPSEWLPFGRPGAPGRWRAPVHLKARWVIEDILPQDEWTVKLDADEELVSIETDAFDELSPDVKLPADVEIVGDRVAYPTRVFQPGHWTPWIDDCLLPRDVIPRSASLRERYQAWQDVWLRFYQYYQPQPAVVRIENHGLERPADYQGRRISQLRSYGRDERADELEASLDWRDRAAESNP